MLILLTCAGDSDTWTCGIACPSGTNGRNTDLKCLATITAIDRQGVVCLIHGVLQHNTRYTYIYTVSSNGARLIDRSSPVGDDIITDLGHHQCHRIWGICSKIYSSTSSLRMGQVQLVNTKGMQQHPENKAEEYTQKLIDYTRLSNSVSTISLISEIHVHSSAGIMWPKRYDSCFSLCFVHGNGAVLLQEQGDEASWLSEGPSLFHMEERSN